MFLNKVTFMNILKVQQAFTVNQEQNLDAPNSES